MRRRILLLCLAAAILLGGCARPGVDASLPLADPVLAGDVWSKFEKISQNAEVVSGPFRINATLYYAGKEGSQRVTVYFWGDNAAGKNGAAPLLWPLRLDILMGPGSVMGKILENGSNFTVYVPRDETAYYHTGDGPALLAFGVPVPFSLADLSLLLTGQFERVFAGNGPPPAYMAKDGLIAYTLNGRLTGTLELSSDGLPRVWRENSGKGWTLDIEYWEGSTRNTPRKLHIVHSRGAEATLIVRELDRPAPFTPAQMELTFPERTRFAPLTTQNQ